MNEFVLHRSLHYTSVGSGLSGFKKDLKEVSIFFSELLLKGYIFKVALSKRLDDKHPLACLFTGEGY